MPAEQAPPPFLQRWNPALPASRPQPHWPPSCSGPQHQSSRAACSSPRVQFSPLTPSLFDSTPSSYSFFHSSSSSTSNPSFLQTRASFPRVPCAAAQPPHPLGPPCRARCPRSSRHCHPHRPLLSPRRPEPHSLTRNSFPESSLVHATSRRKPSNVPETEERMWSGLRMPPSEGEPTKLPTRHVLEGRWPEPRHIHGIAHSWMLCWGMSIWWKLCFGTWIFRAASITDCRSSTSVRPSETNPSLRNRTLQDRVGQGSSSWSPWPAKWLLALLRTWCPKIDMQTRQSVEECMRSEKHTMIIVVRLSIHCRPTLRAKRELAPWHGSTLCRVPPTIRPKLGFFSLWQHLAPRIHPWQISLNCIATPIRPKLEFGGQKHNFSPFSEKYLGSRVFVKNTQLPRNKNFVDMPSCINYIIGNWCKQRATLWATMHGRPCTPGTSYDESLDSAAKAMMSSGSGQERLRLGGSITTLGCKCAGACMVHFPPSWAVLERPSRYVL